MNARHKALAAALLLFAPAFAAHAPAAARGSSRPRAAQTEPRRRPQGPAAGPIIRLPRGEGAADERAARQPAGAREDGSPAPQKWEYCAIKGFNYHQKGFSFTSPIYVPAAAIHYFAGGTEDVEGQNEEEALTNAFVRLGDEGWELAGLRTDFDLSGGTGRSKTFYIFKRPKRRE